MGKSKKKSLKVHVGAHELHDHCIVCCFLLMLSVTDNRVNKLFWCKQQGGALASYVYFLEWFYCRKDELEACNFSALF